MEQEIYLVRHGKIDWKNEKSYIGQLDLPLGKEGIEQSEGLRDFFSKIPLRNAYTSPLKRCVNTLDIILEERQIPKMMVEDFKEINMGDWDGKTFTEIMNNYPEAYKKRGLEIEGFAPPNGENFLELAQRVMPAFEKIAHDTSSGVNKNEPIIILAHAGVIRVIITKILGLDIKNIFKWPIPYGAVYQLGYNHEKEKWNCKNR